MEWPSENSMKLRNTTTQKAPDSAPRFSMRSSARSSLFSIIQKQDLFSRGLSVGGLLGVLRTPCCSRSKLDEYACSR